MRTVGLVVLLALSVVMAADSRWAYSAATALPEPHLELLKMKNADRVQPRSAEAPRTVPRVPEHLRPRAHFDPFLSVEPSRDACDNELNLQRRIAAQMRGANLESPAIRKSHFAWIWDLKLELLGWRAVIENVKEVPEGHIVSVSVRARYKAALASIDNDFIIEKYLVCNGNVKYVGAEEPRKRGRPAFLR